MENKELKKAVYYRWDQDNNNTEGLALLVRAINLGLNFKELSFEFLNCTKEYSSLDTRLSFTTADGTKLLNHLKENNLELSSDFINTISFYDHKGYTMLESELKSHLEHLEREQEPYKGKACAYVSMSHYGYREE